MSSESKLRRFIREEVRKALRSSGSSKKNLNESVMGMTDMPAVNPGTSFSNSGEAENFSYDPNAVQQMADRDRSRKKSRNSRGGRMTRSSSTTQGNKTTSPGGPDKTGYDKSGKRIVFEDTQSSDRVSLWIEGNSLVCEYKSEKEGTQKTELSEERTKDIIEYILRDSFGGSGSESKGFLTT